MNTAERTEKLIEVWKTLLHPGRHWVLFEHGTCFASTEIETGVESIAIEFLKKWGPAVPGTSTGDFVVTFHRDSNDMPVGWLVHYNQRDIMSFVLIDEVEDLYEFVEGGEEASRDEAAEAYPHMIIGLYARQKREADSVACKIVHMGYQE